MGKRIISIFVGFVLISGLWALEKPVIIGKERGEGELIQPRNGNERT